MEPSFDIPKDLLDNGASFTDPFLAGLPLRGAREPLRVGGKARDYRFPTLYGDVRCAVAIFHCSREAVKRLVEDALGAKVEPPRMPLGRTIVALSCYEYRNVRGVRPYNEIALALPLRLDGRAGLPILGAFAGGPDSGYYIAAMPVTSEENRLRGQHYWNLPKFVRRIDIEEEGGSCAVRSYDEDGKTVDLGLEVPMSGKVQRFSTRSFLVTKKDGKLIRSATAFSGDFRVTVRAATLLGGKAGKPILELGQGLVAKTLASLDVEPYPLQTRYASSMNSWFDLPEGAAKETE